MKKKTTFFVFLSIIVFLGFFIFFFGRDVFFLIREEYFRGEKVAIDSIYSKDNFSVYHFDSLMEDADPKTFVVITDVYTKDDRSVFFLGKKIPAMDAKSFEILDKGKNVVRDKGGWYRNLSPLTFLDCKETSVSEFGKYGYRSFQNGKPVFSFYEAYVNDASLKRISDSYYFGDDGEVYYELCRIPDVSKETFGVIEGDLARDEYEVYVQGRKIRGVDSNTVRVLSGGYVADSSGIYFLTSDEKAEKVSYVDPDDLTFLGGGYVTDGDFLIHGEYKIGPYDKESFTVLDEFLEIAKDNSFFYSKHESVPRKVNDWKLDSEYPFDEKGAFIPLRYTGKEQVRGWYRYDYDYEEKGWIFRVVDKDEDLFPGSISGFLEDGSKIIPGVKIITELPRNVIEDLKRASDSRPMKLSVISFMKYPNVRPEVEIVLEKEEE